MTDRVNQIRKRLTDAFAPTLLEIEDKSHLHAGHPGARGGGGHFVVRITATAFDGKSPVRRHRMVNEVLADMMPGEIHALSIRAKGVTEKEHARQR